MRNRVKAERLTQGMTQVELAQKAHVARGVISGLENGTREVITTDTMQKIADALSKKVSDLFFLT